MTPQKLVKLGEKAKSKIYDQRDGNVVAILVVNKSIYVATNSKKSSPRFAITHFDGSISYSHHAEMAVLCGLPRGMRLAPARLYVLRFLHNGGLGLSKPCEKCKELLLENGIKSRNVYYSNGDGLIERGI